MSADKQRLTSAIQRIAKQDSDLRSLLNAAESKGGKPGAAGVGSSTEAQQAQVCCDGSIGDNPNPGTDERDPDADGAGQDGGLNGDDPALLDMGEGTLSGVTDCATGEPICFSGCGHLPPDGWDSPTDPPPDPTYVEGYYFESRDDESTKWGATATIVYEKLSDAFNAGPCFGYKGAMREDGVDYLVEYVCDSGQTWDIRIYRYQCPAPSWVPEKHCNPEPEEILATAWPSDNCTNLAIINGTIVGSKYDPENDGSYSAPRTSINLCDGAGNQISLAPSGSSDCGWKSINSTNDSGYLYDSSGKVIAHIDGNEYSDPTM